MPDPLRKVVIDCSIPDREAAQAYTADQVAAVLEARTSNAISSEDAAARLLDLAERASAVADLPNREEILELDAEELEQRAQDEKAAAAEPPPTLSTAEKVATVLARDSSLDPATRDELTKILRGEA